MGCGATKVAHDQTLGPSRPASKRQPNTQSPVVILSTLDDRLVAVLEAGDIRLLRVKWLESQPDDYRMQRRQELEEHQEEIEKRGGMTPLLGCKEAADLVRNGKREVGALSYGWILPWDPDPTGERIKLLRQELSQRPYIKGLFWDQATLYQPPRTEAQQNSFERAEEVMMDLYASAVGTTCAATPTPSPFRPVPPPPPYPLHQSLECTLQCPSTVLLCPHPERSCGVCLAQSSSDQRGSTTPLGVRRAALSWGSASNFRPIFGRRRGYACRGSAEVWSDRTRCGPGKLEQRGKGQVHDARSRRAGHRRGAESRRVQVRFHRVPVNPVG